MDQRTTSALQPDTTDAILADCISPMLSAARTQIQDLLDDAGDHLPLELQSQLNELLANALSDAYRQGLRDAKLTLAELLDS